MSSSQKRRLERRTPSTSTTSPSTAIHPAAAAAAAITTTTTAGLSKDHGSKKEKSQRTMAQLFESCFFSSVLLIQWSNVVGPKVEKIWSNEPMSDQIQSLIGRQVLNGETDRTIQSVELKWIVLHRQGIICTAFIYHDQSLCALVFVLPVRHLRNFSPYFRVLRDRVPESLIRPLVQLRKIYRRQNIVSYFIYISPTLLVILYDISQSWSTALDFFACRRLAPFIRSIMKLESVSLPVDCSKVKKGIEPNGLFASYLLLTMHVI